MEREKTAIVTSGGGMKCAYSGGALVALGKQLGITDADIMVSASGSTASMFYYMAHQYEAIERAWTRFFASRGVIRYFPFPKFDLDYLVDTIFRELMPLDEAVLAKTKTQWFVPVTDPDTGETKFINNSQWFDPYEIMRAAKAIPAFSAGGIFLGGHRFIDGGMGTDVASLVDKAVAAGAKRILLISNVSPDWGRLAWPMKVYARFQKKVLRELLETEVAHIERAIAPHGVKIVHLVPTYPLPVGIIARNRRKVGEAFYMGYDDAMEKRAEIQKLFKP